MATLPKSFDIQDLVSRHFTLEVRIRRLKEWGWRLGLAIWLCKLASKIAYFNFELVIESEEKPYLYYCPSCHREVNGREPGYAEYKTIACSHCHRQFLVVGSDGGPELVTEETFDLCEYECHFAKPYGFVPEAGCPIHDRA